MQIAIHAGAHHTDEGRLVACLREEAEALRAQAVHVPEPESYHRPLRDLLQAAEKGTLPEDARARARAVTGAQEGLARVVLANPGFFGTPRMAVGAGRFYPAAETRLGHFREIFAPGRVALFLGLRNPATLLPALLGGTQFARIDDLLRGDDPARLRWSDTIARLRSAHPDMPVTLWCDEDTPLIWGRILRALAGIDETVPLKGEFALLPGIMTAEGHARFADYVAERPDLTEAQKERVVAAFLERYADAAALEEELDVPGWDAGRVAHLSALYDEDMERIARMEGVRLIRP